MFFKFKLNHHASESAKNICGTKVKGAVDLSTVTKWFKKFFFGYKNFKDQVMSGRLKTINLEAVFKAIEANLASTTKRVSGEHGISQSSPV